MGEMTVEQQRALAMAAARLRVQGGSQPRVSHGASGSWTDAPTEAQELQASPDGRIVQGVRDVLDSGAQMLQRVIPQGAVDAVNSVVGKVNRLPVIGPATEALGMVPATRPELDQSIRDNEQQYQQSRQATGQTGFDSFRMGGNLMLTGPAAVAAPSRAATLTGRAAQAVPIGAGLGMLQPVTENQDNFWTEKAKQGGTGAVTAGATTAALGGAARAISPKVRESVRLLMGEGVTPTPGQIIGGRAQVLEDKLTSVPLVGDAIASAQRQGLNEFNRAVYARALEPIGGEAPRQIGREGVAEVKRQLGHAYDDLLPKMGFKADPQFQAGMRRLEQLSQNLPAQEAQQFQNIVRNELTERLTPQGLGSGETLKTIEGQFGQEIRRFSKSTDAYQQKLAEALREAQSIFREGVQRSNPQHAEQLASINAGYANYARLRDAASRQGSNNGVITPAQLSDAVRAGDKTAGHGGFASGRALMQDLSDASKDVLAPKYPDSGTTGRIAALAAGGGAAYLEPTLLTGAGIASLPYLPGGRQLMAALLARRPEGAKAVAESVRRLPAPAVVPLVNALQAQE